MESTERHERRLWIDRCWGHRSHEESNIVWHGRKSEYPIPVLI